MDGSDLDFPDTSKYTTSDILSDIYTRASDLDFDYAAQGKALDLADYKMGEQVEDE